MVKIPIDIHLVDDLDQYSGKLLPKIITPLDLLILKEE